MQCSDQPVAASQDGRPTLEGVEAPPTSSGSAGGGKVKDKAELFYKAITATNSYTVGLEVHLLTALHLYWFEINFCKHIIFW